MSEHATGESPSDPLVELSLTLGQVRAEYSTDETVFSSFSWPVYWGEIVGPRPCVLVGGRGTGKTTTLRGLAYGGQHSLRGSDISAWDAIGAYWRVDSMAVAAFSGRGLSDEEWLAPFSHYVNLRMVSLYLGFSAWHEKALGNPLAIDASAISLTAISLNLTTSSVPATLGELAVGVRQQLALLEARLNGPTSRLMQSEFSLLGRPLHYLLEGLDASHEAARLPFTYCIDEFENLRPYQQRVINTLIKHVGDSSYTIKLGIRDSEHRERDTLAQGQTLVDPADYTTVDIVEHLKDQSFARFAAQVCEKRLARTQLRHIRMTSAFPNVSIDEEARILGADRERGAIRRALESQGATPSQLLEFDSMSPTAACLIGYWARAQSTDELVVLSDAIARPKAWNQRVGNYGYAMLFTLRKGRRGVSKLYAGWATYCQLADGNIRLLLELAYEALRRHLSDGHPPGDSVDLETQTLAAAAVGQLTLRELQGQSGIGGQLTYLTLSLGRIFNVFAVSPEGHAPEVNQIRIERDNLVGDAAELSLILGEAVATGCLLAFDGNKQERVSAQTKTWDYQLHPIFAPYFVYSHRRKRRIQLSANEVVSLASTSAPRTLTAILSNRRGPTPALPEQLELYSGFYDAAD